MQNPEPDIQSAGWKPTTSTVGGSVIGTFVGIIVVGVCDRLLKTPLDPTLSSAITGLCTAVAGYCFKDGGRK